MFAVLEPCMRAAKLADFLEYNLLNMYTWLDAIYQFSKVASPYLASRLVLAAGGLVGILGSTSRGGAAAS